MENGQLEEAFLRFRVRLARLAERTMNPILSRRLSPEDVVQETMAAVSRDESAFMSNPDLPLYFKLRTALLQTVAQLERRHLGAGKRDAYREVDLDGALPDGSAPVAGLYLIPDTATSPLSRVARQDRDAILHQALARLNDNDRAILELRHGEGLGNGECAALLGIGEKAASLRYVRALQRLRGILCEYSEFQP
ncbi:MAG: sigma-70 family RNA polymerase sigma factor [Kiritimatiellia bacterium]